MSQSAAIAAVMRNRQLTRASQMLMGICSGIVSDNAINDHEVHFLSTWLKENEVITQSWPGSEIARRVSDILADGVITDTEKAGLLSSLQKITGNFFAETGAATEEAPGVPYDDDPSIFFRSMNFCFTGEFIFGTRADCERIITKLGASPVDNVTKKLNYLVVGAFVTPHWIGTTYGRKIEKAMDYRAQGLEICIVSEQQWSAALVDAQRG